MPVNYFPSRVDEKFVGSKVENFRDDGLRKLTPNGEILFDKSISNIFIENGLEYLLLLMENMLGMTIHYTLTILNQLTLRVNIGKRRCIFITKASFYDCSV